MDTAATAETPTTTGTKSTTGVPATARTVASAGARILTYPCSKCIDDIDINSLTYYENINAIPSTVYTTPFEVKIL
jgi:hypothetical protein